MWPRLLEYLPKIIDSIPHLERFSQIGDKLLSTRAASDAAHVAMVDGIHRNLDQIRDDLAQIDKQAGQIAETRTELSKQIEALRKQAATVTETAEEARSAAVAVGQSVVGLDREIRSLRSLVLATLVVVVGLALMIGWGLLSRAG